MRTSKTHRREKILDDLAQLAGGTVSVLSGIGRQMQGEIKSRANEMAHEMDLVPREDFERLELLLAETLKKQAALEARIEKLEKAKPEKAKPGKAKPETTKPKKKK